jgi:uncharacterized protein YecT (DUF1311 family)
MRIVSIAIVACTLGLTEQAFSEGMLWSRLTGTKNVQAEARIAVDSDRNIYVAGHTWVADDDSGDGQMLLIKHDSSGKRLWTRTLGSKSDDRAAGVAVDAEDNVYVLGFFLEDFEGHRSSGGSDIVLLKFDRDGKRLWTRTFGTKGTDLPRSMATGAGGGVYVTMYTDGAWEGQAKPGFDDIVLLKYNPNGDRAWSRFFGSDQIDVPSGIALDAQDNIYLAGGTSGPRAGDRKDGPSHIFLTKYDSAGTRKWMRQFGTDISAAATAVATDGQGNVYVTGNTTGPLDGIAVAPPVELSFYYFLTKYDSNGARLWTRISGFRANPKAIAVDALGDSYLFGETGDALDGQRHMGGADFFLIKYDKDGTKEWTRVWGTENEEIGQDMAWDKEGFLYLVGEATGGCGGNKRLGWVDFCLMKWTPVAPSFDCAKARTVQEKMICASPELSRLDDSIATLFVLIRKSAAKPEEIKLEQTAWLKVSRNACKTPEQLLQTMQERLEALRTHAGAK